MAHIRHVTVLLRFMVCFTSVILQATFTSALKRHLIPDRTRYVQEHDITQHRHRHSKHFTESSQGSPSECCPSIRRTITPLGGISRDGTLLQLYRSKDIVQKFHEVTCARNVESKPCNFIDQSEWITVCEQKTSYTYAIAKAFGTAEDYRINYIKINSGCSCKIVGATSTQAKNQQSNNLQEIEEAGISIKWPFNSKT